MNENEKSFPIRQVPREEALLRAQYGDEARVQANLEKRWKMYERGMPPLDVLMQIYSMATEYVTSDATVADIGGYDGTDVIRLGADFGHKGQLYYIEPYLNEESEKLQQYNSAPNRRPIIAIRSTIEEVNLPDNSVDFAIAKFMLYHARHLPTALGQIQRILSPDGVFAAATSGYNNKREQRGIEEDLGRYFNVTPPARFNRTFTAENAPRILNEYFDIVDVYPGPMDPLFSFARYGLDDIEEIIDSVKSMESDFHPRPGREEFDRGLQIARLALQAWIQEKGAFIETLDRRIFICKHKTKEAA